MFDDWKLIKPQSGKTMKYIKQILLTLSITIIVVQLTACTETSATNQQKAMVSSQSKTALTKGKRKISQQTKDYWYDGKAEISSYKLTQSRYGELREGTAAFIFVTEPFSTKYNTKANGSSSDNISVLKMNKTLKFVTGIYPYSIMSSTFFPMENTSNSLKIASSQQEWCGMIYMEMLNQKENFIFDLNSYFQGVSFEDKKLDKVILEDDIWSWIRLNPEALPMGKQRMIPMLSNIVMKNKPPEILEAVTNLENKEGISTYKISYEAIGRVLSIQFQTDFPHEILGWEEKIYSDYGSGQGSIISKGERMQTIKSAYWNQSSNSDTHWRGKLNLE